MMGNWVASCDVLVGGCSVYNHVYHPQIPQSESQPCTLELQGVIRFDPDVNELYFCNGLQWKVGVYRIIL